MNILDIVRRIERDLGNQFPLIGLDYIADKLIESYKDIYNLKNWDFYLVRSPFIILSYYQVYAIRGGKIGANVLTIETIPNDNGYDTLYTTYDQTPYQIQSIDGNDITIRQAFIKNVKLKADGGNQIYLYKQDYALPNDCAFNKTILLIDLENKICLRKVSEPTFSKVISQNYYAIGNPICYISKSKNVVEDTNNYNYISIYPFLNPTKKYLELIYYRKPFGNFDTYTISNNYLLEIPEEFSHLLYWMGMELCYFKLGDARLGYAIQKRQQILNDMINANDGDIAMDRIVEQYPYPYFYEDIIMPLNIRISNG